MANAQVDESLLKSLHVLPSTPQVRGLHTFIRNKDTPRDEFIFYSRRLIRLTIEFALSLLPFKVRTVDRLVCRWFPWFAFSSSQPINAFPLS